MPDGPVPDSPVPDSPVPDSPVPDAPVPDSPVPDSPVPDAGKINLALSATASSSGGGTNFFAADKMNDGYREAQCVSHHFHWVSPNPVTPPAWISSTGPRR